LIRVPAPGIDGLDRADGALYLNTDGSAGYYSRDRGLGADYMMTTCRGPVDRQRQPGSESVLRRRLHRRDLLPPVQVSGPRRNRLAVERV